MGEIKAYSSHRLNLKLMTFKINVILCKPYYKLFFIEDSNYLLFFEKVIIFSLFFKYRFIFVLQNFIFEEIFSNLGKESQHDSLWRKIIIEIIYWFIGIKIFLSNSVDRQRAINFFWTKPARFVRLLLYANLGANVLTLASLRSELLHVTKLETDKPRAPQPSRSGFMP